MSKCLKCGATLPPVGDCPTCAAASQPAGRASVPNLLDREIHIDRRRPDRGADSDLDSDAETLREQPLPVPTQPPGMMARAPAPPGMNPAARAPAGAPAGASLAPRPPSSPRVAPAPPPPAAPRAAAAPPPPAPPRPAGAPGLPVMPPRPQAAVSPLPLISPLETEDGSLPVDIDVEEPVAPPPPRAATPRVKPAPPAPAPAAAASGAEVHARPASLWRRLLAFAIDAAAICGVVALYLLLASSVATSHGPASTLTGLDAFVLQVRALKSVLIPGALLLVVLSLVYCTLSAVLWNGRTLGRGVLGLRLVDMRGMAPAPGRAIVRALLATVSFGFFLAGFWMALFDRRGQTLHDKLTSTYVVQPS